MDLLQHRAILAFLDKMLHDAAVDPLDLEADAIIRAYFKRHPETAYRITFMAMQQALQSQSNARGKTKSQGWRWPLVLLRGQD